MTTETKTKTDEKRDEQEAHNDLIAVLNTAEGRRYIWRQLAEARVFSTSFTQQSNSTFFREGQRNVGLRIMTECLHASPELYLLMQKEHYITEEVSND